MPLGVGGAGVGQRQGAGQDAHAVSGLNGEWTSLREGGAARRGKGSGHRGENACVGSRTGGGRRGESGGKKGPGDEQETV